MLTKKIQTLQRRQVNSTITPDLAAAYIVTTFMLVFNWWVESRSPLLPADVDDLFLALDAS